MKVALVIQNSMLRQPDSQYEEYERKQFNERIYLAILELPEKQAKRIYAHFFLAMSMTDIAEAEGVSKMTVCESIKGGLKNLRELLDQDNKL